MNQIAEVEQAGATVYCSMGQNREYHQRRYDFEPPRQKKAAPIKEKRRVAASERTGLPIERSNSPVYGNRA